MTVSPTAEAVDPRGVRFTAGVTSVVLAIGLLTTSWRVLAAQTTLFALCAFVGLQLNPWGGVYRSALRPRLRPLDASAHRSPHPVRFAQGVGFVCTFAGTIAYAAGWVPLGLFVNAFALVAALLSAVFDYCLGCRLHAALHRLWTARTSPDGTTNNQR